MALSDEPWTRKAYATGEEWCVAATACAPGLRTAALVPCSKPLVPTNRWAPLLLYPKGFAVIDRRKVRHHNAAAAAAVTPPQRRPSNSPATTTAAATFATARVLPALALPAVGLFGRGQAKPGRGEGAVQNLLIIPLSLPRTSRTTQAYPPRPPPHAAQLFMAIVAFNTFVDWCEQMGSNFYTLLAAAAVVGSLVALARVMGLFWNRVHARRRRGGGRSIPQHGDGPPAFVSY